MRAVAPQSGFKSGFATAFGYQRFRRWMASGHSPVFIPALSVSFYFSGLLAAP